VLTLKPALRSSKLRFASLRLRPLPEHQLAVRSGAVLPRAASSSSSSCYPLSHSINAIGPAPLRAASSCAPARRWG
jgi:hypothetical protein